MVPDLNDLLMRLTRRAETGASDADLSRSFVEIGTLSQRLKSLDHQILYGRRGAGKTHALAHLAQHARQAGDLAVVLDMRRVGSSDDELPLPQRASFLLAATIDELITQIDAAARCQRLSRAHTRQLDELAAVARASVKDVRVTGEVMEDTVVSASRSVARRTAAEVSADPTSLLRLGVSRQGGRAEATSSETRRTRSGSLRLTLHFAQVARALQELLSLFAAQRVWVLIDEWTVIPLDVQPLLADLLKRCVLPVPNVTMKIAAIRQRAGFHLSDDSGSSEGVGFELGADIAADLSLDDYLAVRDDEERAMRFLADLLRAHVEARLPLGRLLPWSTSETFVSAAFESRSALHTLCEAAEGNPRDAINVASRAAEQAGAAKISVEDVRTGATRYLLEEKGLPLEQDGRLRSFYHWLVLDVYHARRGRRFLATRESPRLALLTRLNDLRLLHVTRRGVVLPDFASTICDEWTIDATAFAWQTRDLPELGETNPRSGAHLVNLSRYSTDLPTNSFGSELLPHNAVPLLSTATEPRDLDCKMKEAGERIRTPGDYLMILVSETPWIVPITSETVSIGRSRGADVRFDDARISRRHAFITRGGAVVKIFDENSRNGLYVNDRRVSSAELEHGDVIRIGDEELVFLRIP